MIVRPHLAAAVAAAIAISLAACASDPPVEKFPVAAPRLATTVKHASGSPLAGGAGARVPGATSAASLQVVVAFVALERVPENLLDPLTAHARVVASTTGAEAVLPAARLLAGARAGFVPDAAAFLARLEGRANRFADLRGALPRGVTATFEAACDRACDARGAAVRERVALHVFRRPGDGVDFAVELAGSAGASEAIADELAALESRPLALNEGLAVIVASPFEGEEARALAAVAMVAAAPADDAPGAGAHRLAFARCAADLASDEVLAREKSAPAFPGAPPRPDLAEAVRALDQPTRRRAALFALAQEAGAPLAEDLALTSEDRTLEAVCAAIARDVAAPGAPRSGEGLGWLVERAALAGLRDLVGQGEVPPEVEVALVRRGGAVGRSLGTFFGAAESATSLADLEKRLRRENRDLLEDSSPAARARAFEWLGARGLAPAGYDPLASAESRRAALDRAEADASKGGRS